MIFLQFSITITCDRIHGYLGPWGGGVNFLPNLDSETNLEMLKVWQRWLILWDLNDSYNCCQMMETNVFFWNNLFENEFLTVVFIYVYIKNIGIYKKDVYLWLVSNSPFSMCDGYGGDKTLPESAVCEESFRKVVQLLKMCTLQTVKNNFHVLQLRKLIVVTRSVIGI